MLHFIVYFIAHILILSSLVFAQGTSTQEVVASKPAHLFILAGQSNMVGLDLSTTFLPTISKEFGAQNVIVVKDAAGGQPIRRWDKTWAPQHGEVSSTNGDLYARLMTKVTIAIKERRIASVTFIWMQGERDARESHGHVYAASLQNVIAQLEDDLDRTDLNVVVGRLSDFDLKNERYPHWTVVRQAHIEVARSRSRAVWVDTDDLNDGMNRAGKIIANDLHYSVDGYNALGQRFADEAITLIRKGERPNIILVMADDQGWGDTGYNGHPFVRTPALDDMADAGMVFNRMYAAAPVCSPTRASVLTGRAPIRTNVTNYGRYMRPHERTIAETLKAAGYRTGLFGKFHLGSGQPNSPCNPSGMGFDEWVIGVNFFDNDPYLSRNGLVERREGKGSVLLMDDALDFIERAKEDGQPMFAVIWFPSPHDPHKEVPVDAGLYEGHDHAGYYREITLLDEQFGRLRDDLRAMNIANDTILWYCSDNGGLVNDTAGGRARKGSIYEGGLRVPSIIEWPGRRITGQIDVPVWTCDLYPTLMAMVGLDVDTTHQLDGQDISGIIAGTATRRAAPMGFWHRFEGGHVTWSDKILKDIMEKQEAAVPVPYDPDRMRMGADAFPQFADDHTQGHAAWTDWPWKLHRIKGRDYEFYNLIDDPMESHDLIADAEHTERIERMTFELNAWMRSVIRSINGEDY